MSKILKLILATVIVFGLCTFASYLVNNASFGFPLWFYKDACAISVNPQTGQKFGTTTETNWLNFGLNIVMAFVVSWAFFWFLKRKKY